MIGGRVVAIVAVALLTAARARGADLDALERAVRAAFSERARFVEERARTMANAALLADEIARLKGGAGPSARADRGLEDALKRFDRVAGQLDEADQRIASQDRTIATLRRKFEEAANAAASQLGKETAGAPVGSRAREIDAIDRARSRVSTLGASEPGFRPVLDVRVSPDDGAIELQQKVLLLEAERDRAQKAIAQLDADAKVLAARIAAKQRLSAELEAAARTAGSELGILRRESENAAQGLHDLEVQRQAAVRQRAELSAALTQVDRRLEEVRVVLRQLGTPKGDIR